jgi:hypothetical protein
MRLEVFMQERLNDPAVMDEVARSALRGRTDK